MRSFPAQAIGCRSDRLQFESPLRVRLHPALQLPGRERIVVGPEVEAVTVSAIGMYNHSSGGCAIGFEGPTVDDQGSAGLIPRGRSAAGRHSRGSALLRLVPAFQRRWISLPPAVSSDKCRRREN